MKNKSLVSLLLVALMVLIIPPNHVVADGPLPEGAQVLPELGPTVPGQTPGVNGYKVFGPDAVRQVEVRPLAEEKLAAPTAMISRRGSTDVWYYWLGPFKPYVYSGSHTSDSDLNENQIWVDGYLKRVSENSHLCKFNS